MGGGSLMLVDGKQLALQTAKQIGWRSGSGC